MPKTPLDYDLLAIFVAVAEEKSFSKAAIRCGIAKGTVSRAIVELEEILGAQLIHRNTHAVALSTSGTALYERTAKPLRALDEAIGHLPEPGEQPSGLLRLTTAPSLGAVVLPEVLAQFALRYLAISFELLVTNAPVDIVAQGFDLAVRIVPSGLKSSTLTVRRLGGVNGGFYAASSRTRSPVASPTRPRGSSVAKRCSRRSRAPTARTATSRVPPSANRSRPSSAT